MKIIAILLLIGLYSCKTNHQYNIEIVNEEFNLLIENFEYRAQNATNYKSNIISISINQNNDTLELGLYFAKKLKPSYLIGSTHIKNKEIYFYSSSKKIETEALFKIKQPLNKSQIDTIQTYVDLPYSEYYHFINGKFIIMPLHSTSR